MKITATVDLTIIQDEFSSTYQQIIEEQLEWVFKYEARNALRANEKFMAKVHEAVDEAIPTLKELRPRIKEYVDAHLEAEVSKRARKALENL